MEPIRYFNRHTQHLETEQVYGESFLRWTYHNPLGRAALWTLVRRPAFSKWYGHRMDQPATRAKIQPFIEQYQLDPTEFLETPDSFPHFNAFFSRKLRPEARPISPTPASAVFPADGRHLGFPDASAIRDFFVKGQRFDLPSLLGDPALAEQYAHGALVLSRLCPVDYHRFHFPASGTPSETTLINGPLYSVSPIALRKNLAYLWQNKRTLTRLDTPNFGTILLLEIGATCVGTIRQTFTPGKPVAIGAEKGYFAFGGSSTITIFPPGRIRLAEDLLSHTAQQTELYAQMGTPLGTATT